MKRFILMICLLLILTFMPAYAEIDQPIEFMDIPWNTSAYEYFTKVRINLGLSTANPAIDDFSIIGDYAVVLEALGTVQHNCGYRIDIFPHLEPPRNTFYVAGYPIDCVSAQTLFSVQNGYVNTNPVGSHVAQIKYMIDDGRIVDSIGATKDLLQKLSALYGEQIDSSSCEENPEDGSAYYTHKWSGKGSFVMLSYRINTNDTADLIQILYGIDNAQDLINNIQNPELTLKEIIPDVEIDPENSDNL